MYQRENNNDCECIQLKEEFLKIKNDFFKCLLDKVFHKSSINTISCKKNGYKNRFRPNYHQSDEDLCL